MADMTHALASAGATSAADAGLRAGPVRLDALYEYFRRKAGEWEERS